MYLQTKQRVHHGFMHAYCKFATTRVHTRIRITLERGAEDGVPEPLQVDSGESRRRLSADTERTDIEGTTGERGRRRPPPAPDEQRVTQQLVGARRHGGLHAYQRGPEREQVVAPHVAHLRVDPRHGGAPRRALLPRRLVRALLPRLLGVQLRAQLAVLAVQLGDRLVAGGGEAGSCVRGGGEEAVDEGLNGGVAEGEGLAGGGEDDGSDLGAAQDGELAGLLEQPRAPLGEAHLPCLVALDAPDLDLLPPHARPTRRHCCYLLRTPPVARRNVAYTCVSLYECKLA
uniref:Uncharacterized protein n=1 Tax=Arundo donax TaxID=35708 RepID=A0A0A9HZZ7_ARUDO